MGFYPPFGARRGTPEYDDHIVRQPVPHPSLEGYTCWCSRCEDWCRAHVVVGSLVVGRVPDPKAGSGGLAWSWGCDQEPNWDNPIKRPSLVLGPPHGVALRKDLTCVVLLTPDMGLRVSAAEWLVVLAGGRAIVQPSGGAA